MLNVPKVLAVAMDPLMNGEEGRRHTSDNDQHWSGCFNRW